MWPPIALYPQAVAPATIPHIPLSLLEASQKDIEDPIS